MGDVVNAAFEHTQLLLEENIMKNHSILLAALIGTTLVVSVPVLAAEEVAAAEPVVTKTYHTTAYLNGGIGKDEQEFMRRSAHKFPLRMTFFESENREFITGVTVVIFDAKGKQVFELSNAGPMLYVMLPNGKYKIRAHFKGVAESRGATLRGRKGKDLYFRWNGTAKQ